MLVASQALYDCRKDKFLLSYTNILRLAALAGLSQLFKDIPQVALPTELDSQDIKTRGLALKTREMLVDSYALFYDSPQVW